MTKILITGLHESESGMKRLFNWSVIICVFAGIGYFAWPAVSAYQIYNGAVTADEPLLKEKINWVSVRQSFEGPVREAVKREVSKISKDNNDILGLSNNVSEVVVKQALKAYMTPKGLINLAKSGGKIDLTEFNIAGQLNIGNGDDGEDGGLGGLLKKATEFGVKIPGITGTTGLGSESSSKKQDNKDDQSFSLSNIKSLRFNSLTEFQVSIAKDGDANKPDVTAVMGFEDMDWKLTKLIPHL